MIQERLELLTLARDATASSARDVDVVAAELRRFAPSSFTDAAWRDEISRARERLAAFDAKQELAKRLHVKQVTWPRLVDRLLPGLALGIATTDSATLARLKNRDAWTAAIAARLLGTWETGKPPTLSAVCDAFAWRSLGLQGRPKRCPPEVRSLFLQRELHSDPGPADRQLRLFVARALESGTDLRAMRDALVRRWLLDRPLLTKASLSADVQRVAKLVTQGTFGERKVFISSIWDAIRREAQWASLSLADFKSGLVAAQRAGEIELARADLVAAMDPQLVAASETRGGGASFHFVVRKESK